MASCGVFSCLSCHLNLFKSSSLMFRYQTKVCCPVQEKARLSEIYRLFFSSLKSPRSQRVLAIIFLPLKWPARDLGQAIFVGQPALHFILNTMAPKLCSRFFSPLMFVKENNLMLAHCSQPKEGTESSPIIFNKVRLHAEYTVLSGTRIILSQTP